MTSWRDGMTDEMVRILEAQAADADRPRQAARAAFALQSARLRADLEARTGCRFGCAERGVSTYCAKHYTG
jgi:hypothetical protein